MSNSIIQIKGLKASYDHKTVLSQVNLSVYERDFLGIIGPNGGGKTTLIKCILGLHKADKGNISFYKNGKEVPEINMGYLPQYNSIDKKFPISVYEVVLSGLSKQKSIFQKYKKEHHEQARQTISRMGLEGLEERAIGQLSGGQLQRVLLGRALVSKPEVVILDEPNTYIDKRFESKLYSLLEEINQELAIIIVSHDIGTVLKTVKTIACVNDTVPYHPHTEVPTEWLEENFGCTIEMLGHGTFPHRVLKCHHEENEE